MAAMAGRAVEAEGVAARGDGLGDLHARIAGRFARREPRERARGYLGGLLGGVERKNGWQLAEAPGERTPDGVQRLSATADRDADLVRDDLRAYVVAHLGDPAGVLIVDETGSVKKGTESVGVARQYSGTAGRVEDCQVGVSLTYAAPNGHAFLDRELSLHREWAEDRERRREAHVPEGAACAAKPGPARRLLARALAAGVPAAWAISDEVYGGDRRRRAELEARSRPFVLAVKRNEYVPVPDRGGRGARPVAAAAVAAGLDARDGRRRSAGDGAKGPRVYDWARIRLVGPAAPGRGRWLGVRRSLADPEDLAYYACFGRAEAARGEVGLDQYEVRHWTSWYRHIALALLAHAYLAVARHRAGATGQRGGADSRPTTISCP